MRLAKLNTLRRAVRPYKATLLPPAPPVEGGVGVGDAWPGKLVIYDYVLCYKFSLKEASDAVAIRFPSLSAQLYESSYEAQLWARADPAPPSRTQNCRFPHGPKTVDFIFWMSQNRPCGNRNFWDHQ